jgi:hypothetical protein
MVTRLSAVTLVDTTPLRVSKWITDSVNPPCALIAEDEPFKEYDESFEGGARYHFRVVVYGVRASEETAQEVIAGLRDSIGSGSIRAALNGNYSAAYYGVCHTAGPVQRYVVGALEYLGCEFLVEVVTS